MGWSMKNLIIISPIQKNTHHFLRWNFLLISGQHPAPRVKALQGMQSCWISTGWRDFVYQHGCFFSPLLGEDLPRFLPAVLLAIRIGRYTWPKLMGFGKNTCCLDKHPFLNIFRQGSVECPWSSLLHFPLLFSKSSPSLVSNSQVPVSYSNSNQSSDFFKLEVEVLRIPFAWPTPSNCLVWYNTTFWWKIIHINYRNQISRNEGCFHFLGVSWPVDNKFSWTMSPESFFDGDHVNRM